IKLTNSGFTLGKKKVKEGDWLSIDVQRDSKPIIYFGPLPLTISDPAKNGLIDLIRLTRPYLSKIEIRANILQETDSQYASLFSASGTGFCDTSYMFLKDSGIYLLRKILFAVNQDIKLLALDELSTLLENEFYNLMKDSEDQTIAPELLNVPLGDFIPKNTELLSELKKRLQEEMPDLTDTDFDRTCLELSQSGAGKDLRGARLAITQPDFFQIQIKALFRAAARRLQEGKTFIPPEIIIPMVMDKRELKTLRFGKMINGIEIPGIQTLADQISQEAGIDHIPHRVGLKIDMPSAALQARNMAQYADFLLFDPDSLTEKVFSLSQENAKDWLFHYSNLDILPDTLFTQLRDEIKDLITHAISGARMIRPDINIGILTQKENPWDILSFALDQNLDFISCPVKSLPIYQCLMARKQIQEKDTNSNSGIS
ncbi:MAG: hypothetical protein OEZ36_09070, partial [Spirochaetota bacterium]|nr:hypothetical protein [Spirochaetota bacterium]